jgi:preprotein translocase subunit SecF
MKEKEIKEDQEAKADSKTAETPAPQELGKKAKEAKETKASQKPQDSQDSDDPKEPAEEKEHEESLKEAIAKQAIEDEAPLSSSFTLRKILGGDILTAQVIRRQIWLIVLVVFFIIIYISNRYSIQQDMIEIDQLQNAKYKALSSSSQITERSRESNVLKMLQNNKDSVLHIATQPPYIINVPENE